MIAPSHASKEILNIRNIAAAANVDAEMTESRVASSPELTREAELTFFPTALTYLPNINLTITATAIIIIDIIE